MQKLPRARPRKASCKNYLKFPRKVFCARPRKVRPSYHQLQLYFRKCYLLLVLQILTLFFKPVSHLLSLVSCLLSPVSCLHHYYSFIPRKACARPAQDCPRSQEIMLATVPVLTRLSWWWQETGDRKQETGDRRQETGDKRQETGDRDRKQETGDSRRESRWYHYIMVISLCYAIVMW